MMAKQIHIAFTNNDSCLKLNKIVRNCSQASYSFIISLALYFNKTYPFLFPPNSNHHNQNSQQILKKSNFQPWCDYFVYILQNRYAYKHSNQAVYILCEVKIYFLNQIKRKYLDDYKQINFLQVNFQVYYKKIEKIFEIQTLQQKNKKIAMINFSTSQLRNDPCFPKINFFALVSGIWYNNQIWSTYKILLNQFPSQEQFSTLDTIILSGSSLSVNQNNPSVNKFLYHLKEAVLKNKKLKVVGFCFGHQSIAKMLGGKIEKKVWIGGIQSISFKKDLTQPYMAVINQNRKEKFYMSEYHTDYVVQIPQNFEVIGWSDSCQVQSMKSKNNQFLSFQFHPEYSSPYIKMFQEQYQKYTGQQNKLNALRVNKIPFEVQIQQHEECILIVRKIISKFINS